MAVRDKKIVIILVGFIILALAYFLIFKKAATEREQLQAENHTLQMQYDDLSIKASQAEMYKEESARMNEEMGKIYEKFPSYLKIENGIMDVVELENTTQSFVSSLTVGSPMAKNVEVGEASAEGTTEQATDAAQTTTDTQQTSTTAAYQLYDVSTVIEFESGYAGMKNLINLVVGDSEKKTIDTLNMTYDGGEGKITGSMLFDTYFLYGLDKPYEAPTIPNINHGTQNVFGTAK